MTPWAAVHDEAANNQDKSPTHRVQRDHAGQQEPEHHHGRTAFAVAVNACDCHFGNADQKRHGEQHSAGLREPKPVAQPSPVASESRHASSVGQYLVALGSATCTPLHGIATRALEEFLRLEATRLLYGGAARDNVASIRVLTKCGFVVVGEGAGSRMGVTRRRTRPSSRWTSDAGAPGGTGTLSPPPSHGPSQSIVVRNERRWRT